MCLGMCQVMGAVALARRLREIETRATAGDHWALATLAVDWPFLVCYTLARMRGLLADAGIPRANCDGSGPGGAGGAGADRQARGRGCHRCDFAGQTPLWGCPGCTGSVEAG